MMNCFGKLIIGHERALYTSPGQRLWNVLGRKHIIDWSPERAKHNFTINIYLNFLCYALSGLKITTLYLTQGVALGLYVTPFHG